MEYHLVLVATSGFEREFTTLIGVQGTLHVVDGDDNVVLVLFKFLIFFLFLLRFRFGVCNPLVLALHVAFLGFLGLREEFVDIFNVHEGAGKVVAFPDGLKPHTCCGEDRGSM